MQFTFKKYLLFIGLSLFLVSCRSYVPTSPEFSSVLNQNQIPIKKVHNFRTLSNIKNTEGKTIKDSIFYRSGDLSKLKELEKLKQLNLGEIIDLRTKNEVSKKPDILPENITYKNYAAFEDQEDQLNQAKKLVLKGKVNANDAHLRMIKFYKDYLTENPETIKQILTEILDSNQPILYHCTAGKDRTGMITALILSILKFDKETIYQEYLLSNNLREKIIKKRLNTAKNLHFLFPKMDISVLEKLSWIERSYLDAALDEINLKYGSIDNYIHQVLGINEEKRMSYIQKFIN